VRSWSARACDPGAGEVSKARCSVAGVFWELFFSGAVGCWPRRAAQVLMESALNGTINEEYIYLNGERVARVDRPSGTVNDDHRSIQNQ
jgi:hypothetical protein